MTTATVAKSHIKDKKAQKMVTIPLQEYRELLATRVPHYYLKGKAARDLDKLVEEGLKEYKDGKTRKLRSLADLD
ncbi:MAG TPA: hypothetical protein VIJ88_00505 [Candidatus Paceibacterota bacterium]